jgi:choline-sulfatase
MTRSQRRDDEPTGGSAPAPSSQYWGPFTQPPNVLILMTDQQRTAQYLPVSWVAKHLPNLQQLMQTGVCFPNAMTNATACAPSRSVLWTSTYPAINGVVAEGSTLQLGTNAKTELPIGTLGQMLAQLAPNGVTYDIAYKGKWHLDGSYQQGTSASEQQQSSNEASQLANDNDMSATYGFPGWTSPDFGTAMATGQSTFSPSTVNTLGGGGGGNDTRVATGTSYVTGGTVESAQAYLTNRFAGGTPSNPFCLVVSLLNPHDIFVSPYGYVDAGYEQTGQTPPWQQAPFTEITTLPPSFTLTQAQLDNKPSPQQAWRSGLSQDDALDYLRFYAYLETLTDVLLGEVLSALPTDQLAHTLIVRLVDHGEMGMSQGGMWQKEQQTYNETLLVPMIFSNPGLPQGQVCTGLAGLIDIVPTLAEICALSNLATTFAIQGTSLAPAILAGSSGTTCTQLLFATEDGATLRALIEDQLHNAKYAVIQVGQQWQCELYPFSYDSSSDDPWPSEVTNLVPVNGLHDGTQASSPEIQCLWHDMHELLTEAMRKTNTTPTGWPAAPPMPGQGPRPTAR